MSPTKAPARALGKKVPRTVRADVRPAAADPGIPNDIAELTACPVCRHDTWTPVCEFNRFLLRDEAAPDPESAVYHYSLCHACGVVFARHRPIGERYRYLVDRFEEVLGRVAVGEQRGTSDPLSSGTLDAAGRAELQARAARGVFVSDHLNTPKAEYIPGLLRDRLSTAAHVEMLGSLLALRSPRVLELRPRYGSIGGALTRLYGATVSALPLFETQQLLVQEVYGVEADHLLDYDRFTIPYEGPFDLIVGNHLLTHAVRPGEVLATIHRALTPGGHLYLYNEPDEEDFIRRGKSIFGCLNPFHLQTFDGASLMRALRMNGFEVLFTKRHEDNFVVLARRGEAALTPMPEDERERRLAEYRAARDVGILRLPEDAQGHFAGEWDAVIARGLAAGVVDEDETGVLRYVKGRG